MLTFTVIQDVDTYMVATEREIESPKSIQPHPAQLRMVWLLLLHAIGVFSIIFFTFVNTTATIVVIFFEFVNAIVIVLVGAIGLPTNEFNQEYVCVEAFQSSDIDSIPGHSSRTIHGSYRQRATPLCSTTMITSSPTTMMTATSHITALYGLHLAVRQRLTWVVALVPSSSEGYPHAD